MEFLDIEQITARGGPEAFKFGDPYTWSCHGKVEQDRYIYLYNVIGDATPSNFRSLIRQIAEFGKQWGWKGIRWERIRKDGQVHVFEFKI